MSILTPNPITVNELALSHAFLDRCSVPRRLRGVSLTLPERIAYLHCRLVIARDAARAAVIHKQIFVLSRKEWEDFIPKEYRTMEVKA